ncbi:MAG TPA: RHS repeat domain-containing protein [Thermoflexus sp.]|nr:RHS repeat domain-containing protein [Thermoflexus sp.]
MTGSTGLSRLDGTIIDAFAYEVNAVGLRTAITATTGWRNQPVVVEHYTHDPLRRLTGVTDSEGFQAVYDYDAAGNRVRWWANDDLTIRRPRDGFEVTYVYDAADRLLESVLRSPGRAMADAGAVAEQCVGAQHGASVPVCVRQPGKLCPLDVKATLPFRGPHEHNPGGRLRQPSRPFQKHNLGGDRMEPKASRRSRRRPCRPRCTW